MELSILNLNEFSLGLLKDFQKDVIDISSRIYKAAGYNETELAELEVDSKLMKLAKHNRDLFSKTYDTLSALPSLFALHGGIAKQLSADLSIGALYTGDLPSVRVDFPDESKHLDPWHQESAYYDAPGDSFTVWMPFSEMTKKHGPVEFVSQTGAFNKLEVNYSKTRPYVKIMNESCFEEMEIISPLVGYGCAAIFSHRQIHRSSPCKASTPRCSIQLRYNVLNNSEYIKKYCPKSYKVIAVHNWDQANANRIFD